MSTSKERMIELAQGQLDAYNARDIEKFCQNYHPEVEVFSIDTMERKVFGMKDFRPIYEEVFRENPRLHCELRSRIVVEGKVLDEEWVTGFDTKGPKPSHVVAIYGFQDNLIKKVWFAR